MGFFNSDVEECAKGEAPDILICKKGKSAVKMRATKTGMEVMHTVGQPKEVDELINRMSNKSRIKNKNDLI